MRNLKKASKEAPGPVQDKEEGEGEAGDVVDDGEIPGPSNVSKIPVSFTVFHFLSAFPAYPDTAKHTTHSPNPQPDYDSHRENGERVKWKRCV